MLLTQLIGSIDKKLTEGLPDIEIADVAYDSRKVSQGSLFVAISGAKTDGHAYIHDAISRGAKAVVVQNGFKLNSTPAGLSIIRVPNTRQALACIAGAYYGDITKRLCLVGITGTNGKTTTSYLVESVLRAAGFSTGVIGTVNYRFGCEVLKAPFTTPESLELQKLLRRMADQKITHVVMEVSSHALDQERVTSCRFDVAVYTNLSRDHLDYHHDLEDYFHCKERLFTTVLEESRGAKRPCSVINIDDPWGRELLKTQRDLLLTYGLREHGSDITARNMSFTLDGIEAEIITPKGTFNLHSKLLGEYNLYNMLAATGVGLALGLSRGVIKKGIEALSAVPGRMDRIDNDCKATVLVDYAHTPDALEKVLSAVQALNPKRLISVFGCGGNRDQGKRPIMGRIAAQFSRIVIITSDNPRDEDPLEIIRHIEEGIKGSPLRRVEPDSILAGPLETGYVIMPERREAIRLASRLARPGDAIVIAGKGHEDYQIVRGNILSFDDRTEVRHAFGSLS
ncbi:MAG: UDP-N-acetylmuramoyl-L-alanyl-D-glutamate--2,6-diaminopimelate ligase [Desulfovibrionales bacterium]|nr:UDP-N-acetylmuramoyl-L-alanyl-D-glutamate--2,6-diaminopimelate ligase [Desulfovibrionales bacterium]